MSCWDVSCFGNRSYAREISNVEGLKLKLGHDRQTDHARPILCLISLWPIRKVRTTNEMESPANEWNGNAVASSPAHVWLRYPRQDPWSQDRRTVLISSGSCPWSRDLSFRFFNYSSWFFSLIPMHLNSTRCGFFSSIESDCADSFCSRSSHPKIDLRLTRSTRNKIHAVCT